MFKYVGWQVGISYQSPEREGLTRVYVQSLLERMRDQGMNLISFMMVSYGINDSLHDGYAWPVKNPRLRCYLDEKVKNARIEDEFLRGEIERAHRFNFHVQLFANNFTWNHQKALMGYPDIAAIQTTDPNNLDWHHWAKNKDTWAMACDEATDLLEFYNSPSVKSYGWEMMGSINDNDYEQTMHAFANYIRTIRPNIEIWHHGYYEFQGPRRPEVYRSAGIDVVFPVIHLVTTEERLKKIIVSSENIPLVLHVDTRDLPTEHYNIPIKTAEYIEEMGRWISRNAQDNLLGVMFFNEVHTSEKNKQAVNRVLEQWKKEGLFRI